MRVWAAAVVVALSSPFLLADVFQWQWVDPNDHSLGKTQSSILCPDGAGQTAGPGSSLGGDLTKAYLYSLDLSYSSWFGTILNEAYLGKANLNQMLLYGCSLRNADFTAVQGMGHFRFSDLTGADFTDAKLKHFSFSTLDNANFTRADLSNGSFEQGTFHGANFTDANISGVLFVSAAYGGFTEAQLHQTASYKNRDLRGVSFTGVNDMSGWDFSGGLDMTGASFFGANLTRARFNGAIKPLFLNVTLNSADLSGAQLRYVEASNLTGADLSGADLTDTFANGCNWTNARFNGAILTNTDLRHGDVTGADFTDATLAGTDLTEVTGFTIAQLSSTASYKARELRRVTFSIPSLDGVDFRGFDLTNTRIGGFKSSVNADFSNANLTNGAVTGESLEGAHFADAVILGATVGPLSAQQLYSTASYQARNLRGVHLGSDMSGWDFSGINLTDAVLFGSVAGANFSGSSIAGSRWDQTGITAAQLYSTASYQNYDLHGISFRFTKLSGWSFRGVDLTGAGFQEAPLRGADFATATLASANLAHAVLTDADFAGADLSGADLSDTDMRGAQSVNFGTAIRKNTILPDGTIDGFEPDYTIPTIRNYTGRHPIPIHVKNVWDVRNTVLIRFDDQPWGSTISFDPGIPILIGGTNLQLEFEQGIDGSTMIGRTFQIFDWTGVTPTGQFRIYSQFWDWDASRLYVDGTVTLIPEPWAIPLCVLLAIGMPRGFRRFLR